MSVTHVCIGPFEAVDINLSGSDFVAGIPSPSAALGFVGSISRRLSQSGWSHKALLVIHSLEEQTGRQRGEQTVKSGRLIPLEVAESLTGRGTFSIIAEIPGRHTAAEVAAAVMRMRFCGGAIFAPRGRSLPQVVRFIEDGDIHGALARLPRGMLLSPPMDRTGGDLVSFGEITSLEGIARRAYTQSLKAEGGFVVPAPVGFRVLEETLTDTPPKGCRDANLPFALVDSAVGLAEFVSIRNRDLFDDLEEAFDLCGWSWSCQGQLRMFSKHHLSAASV